MNINKSYFTNTSDLLSSNPFQNEFLEKSLTENDPRQNPVGGDKYPQDIIKEEFCVIQTDSRNFDFESLLNFRVKINASENKTEKYPVYENNPTLIQSHEQRNVGVLGSKNPLYNPNEKKGDIIGYDRILFSGEKGCKILQKFKNIISFDVKRIEIPIRILENYHIKSFSTHIFIQELSGFHDIKTTNGLNEQITQVLIFDCKTEHTVIFVSIKPIQFKIPTNSFSSLSFDINFPFFQKNNFENIDSIEINAITTDSSGYIFIDTTTVSSIFKVGDKIKCIDSRIDNDKTVLQSRDIDILNNHLSQIHIIQEINSENIKLNTISLLTDIYQGDLATEQVISGNITSTIIPKMINLDAQIHIILEMKTKENIL